MRAIVAKISSSTLDRKPNEPQCMQNEKRVVVLFEVPGKRKE